MASALIATRTSFIHTLHHCTKSPLVSRLAGSRERVQGSIDPMGMFGGETEWLRNVGMSQFDLHMAASTPGPTNSILMF
ncbi:hypothetical protein SCLCIDRAFT_33970 [Scleroderma citrinum Foug A]|uniref:Uncharacterized protein n=1 Tax=Scleroderma citrinum Foug A TaxID=1036808 RepID=A0A0C2ZCT3_9AGAM|nr:hypothetical protein SCLCIDRAFT_33970 [Scleroderma citrinum Foug A]